MPSNATAAESAIGAVLRTARERAGLTQRALARVMGVSPATIANSEADSDPRLSTLARYVAALPSLNPGRVLFGSECGAPLPSHAAWEAWRRLQGPHLERVVLSRLLLREGGHEDRFEFRGLTPLGPDAECSSAILRTLFRGSSQALRSLLQSFSDGRPSARVSDGPVEHEFSWDADESSFAYARNELVCPEQVASGSCLSWTPALGVRALTFRVRREGEAAPCLRLEARPAALGQERDEAERLRAFALRNARMSVSGDSASIELTRPMSLVSYTCRWDFEEQEGDDERLASPDSRPPAPGAALRRARELAGLSQRQLAIRCGISATAIRDLEAGGNARRLTARACLGSLPSLSPELLLPHSEARFNATSAELWEYYRQLFGCEVAEERKVLVVHDSGWADVEYSTRGLRSLSRSRRGLAVRYAGVPLAERREPVPPEEILPLDENGLTPELRTRVLSMGRGRPVHELVLDVETAARGASFRRLCRHSHRFELENAAIDRADSGPAEGFQHSTAHPTRKLVLEVRFLGSFRPRCWVAARWPACVTSPQQARSLNAGEVLPTARVQVARDGARLSITHHEPLVGMRHVLGWSP